MCIRDSFDADGYFQQYGTYARMSDEPDFQYLGGGAVTFKLETEDGIIYNLSLIHIYMY